MAFTGLRFSWPRYRCCSVGLYRSILRSISQHQKLVCAHEHVAGQKPGDNFFDQFDTVKLKQIGCSDSDDTVTVGEARNPPPDLNWFAEFGSALLLSPLPQTLIVTLVVYVVVRVLGWVIAAS